MSYYNDITLTGDLYFTQGNGINLSPYTNYTFLPVNTIVEETDTPTYFSITLKDTNTQPLSFSIPYSAYVKTSPQRWWSCNIISRTIRKYKNGVLVGTISSSSNNGTTYPHYVGVFPNNLLSSGGQYIENISVSDSVSGVEGDVFSYTIQITTDSISVEGYYVFIQYNTTHSGDFTDSGSMTFVSSYGIDYTPSSINSNGLFKSNMVISCPTQINYQYTGGASANSIFQVVGKNTLSFLSQASAGTYNLLTQANDFLMASYIGTSGTPLVFTFRSSTIYAEIRLSTSLARVALGAMRRRISSTSVLVSNTAGTGVQLNAGSTTWTASSDIRLKKKVSRLTTPALDLVCQLRPVEFLYLNDNNYIQKRVGFIAQEVEQIFPKAVVTDEDGIKSIMMTALIPYIIKATQELISLL